MKRQALAVIILLTIMINLYAPLTTSNEDILGSDFNASTLSYPIKNTDIQHIENAINTSFEYPTHTSHDSSVSVSHPKTQLQEQLKYSSTPDPNTWYTGESVLIVHNYTRYQAELEEYFYNDLLSPSTVKLQNKGYVYVSDDNYCSYTFTFSSGSSAWSRISTVWIINNIDSRPGTLTLEANTYVKTHVTGTEYTLGDSVASTAITGLNFLLVQINSYYSYSAATSYTDQFTLTMEYKVINDPSASWVTFATQTYTTGDGDGVIDVLKHQLDYISFVPDELNENLRSDYKYASSTQLLHKLAFQTSSAAESIRIYAPLGWNYSTITPFVQVSYDTANNYWDVQTTYPARYEIFFLSGNGWGVDYTRKPYLLSISDVSSDYAQQSTFESGVWRNEFYENPSYTFDTIELSTSVIFEGSFSLHLVDSNSADREILSWVPGENEADSYNTPFDPVNFYLAFSYYRVSGTLNLYWRGLDGSWHAEALDGETNRWNQVFFYLTKVDEIRFDTTTNAAFEYYIDSIRIYKPSTQISTIGLDSYQIQGTLRSWDNRQNPSVPNSQVQIQLRDRTANSLVKSWNNIETDVNGVFSVTYSQQLQEKEYEVRVWNWESWFGNGWTYTQLMDLSQWHGDYMATYTESIVDDYLVFTWAGLASHAGGLGYLRFGEYSWWDLIADAYYLELYSVGDLHGEWTKYVHAWYGDYAAYNLGETNATGTWITYAYTIDDLLYSSGWSGDWSMQSIHVQDAYNSTDAPVTTYIRDFHALNTQKTYFTPVEAGDSIFQYSEENEYDYSEGTKEELYTTSASLYPQQDGTVLIKTSNRVYGSDVYVDFSETLADFYDYSTIVFRAKTNYSGTANLRMGFFRNVDWHGIGSYQYLSTSWQVFSIDASTDLDWDGSTKQLFFKLSLDDGSGTTGNEYVWIDFIRLVHIKTSSINTGNNYAYTQSENNSLTYTMYSDGTFAGYYSDLEVIPLNMSIGDHNLTLLPISDVIEEFPGVFIEGNSVFLTYTVTESDLCTITLINQKGEFIDPRRFIIEIDSQRIQGDTFLWEDTSTSVNLTISDFWGNILYQNTSEVYERFKDFILTLYSVKIWNMQPNPIYLYVTNGPVYSEWVMPGEIAEYMLWPDNYNFTIIYSDITGSFGAACTNGTIVQFIYVVSADTALVVAGNTIQDVYSNIISLQQDLQSTNSSIHAAIDLQTENITMQFEITNSNISLIIGNLTIMDSNLEGNFTLISNTLTILDSNLAGNFTFITQFLSMLDSSILGNTTIITEMLEVLDSNLAGNFTATLLEIDLTNSTQVSLLIQNYHEILESQQLAAEYMSVLRIETYAITYSEPYLNVVLQTNWRNSTVTIFANGTKYFQGNESDVISIELVNPGAWNITVVIKASTFEYVYESWVVVVPDPVEYVSVYFSLATTEGVGLPWESARVLVNGSRIFDPRQKYLPGTVLLINVTDYFGISLLNTTIKVNSTQEQEIVLQVPLIYQILKNEDDVPLQVIISRGTFNTTYTIDAKSAIIIPIFANTYDITIIPIATNDGLIQTNSTHILTKTAKTLHGVTLDGLRAITLTAGLLAQPLSQQKQEKEWYEKWQNVLIVTLSSIFSLAVISLAVAFVARKILAPTLGSIDHIQAEITGKQLGLNPYDPEETIVASKKKKKKWNAKGRWNN